MEHIGTTIRRARDSLQMSQGDLAELAGVNHGYLSLVEAGKRTPSPRWEAAINQALASALAERGAA